MKQKEQEMREKFPHMFVHPELRAGEVWAGDCLIDVVSINAQIYRNEGVPSTRISPNPTMGKIKGIEVDMEFRAVFMDLKELILAEEKMGAEAKK